VSGGISVLTQPNAGTYNFNLPTVAGSAGQPLLSGGGGTAPMTFGTLLVPGGGTGATTFTAHAPLIGEGTGAIVATAAMANGQVLIGSNGADPVPATLTQGTNVTITVGAGSITIAAAGGSGGCTTSGASGQVLTDNGAGGCASDTSTLLSAGALSLGLSGTAGSVKMGNATSGTITIQPVTGALGSVTASLPANTGTIAELNLAQTWSALQSFNSSDLALNGATSGSIKLNAAAIAGSNTLTFPAGTTDFSATGGTSQVVKQTSSGGAFTVAQLACGDLSNSGTGCSGNASGTVNSGTAGQIAYYATSTNAISGNANANISSGALTLGTAGSVVGSIAFDNATSGSITIAPPTGALGSVTATIPANTGTIAELNLAQTWSALQSFNSSDFALNGSVSGSIKLNAAATAGSNTLTFPAGTTDFSATGGTSQVVKQTSSGGAFTVAQLACGDLSNSGTGCSNNASGTVNAGTSGQLAYYATSTAAVSGNANANISSGALTLGQVGSVVGSIAFDNATSGSITISPPTGALGSVTATIPANTGTIAELNLAQTWTALQSHNTNDLAMNGATSGSIKLNAAATAGSNTITFPAGTTDFSATGGASQVIKQTSSGGAFTVAQLACGDLSNAGAACTASNTITLNAGANVAITAPGAMTLGGTFTFGSTSDTPRFAGLGLGGVASGANILTIFGSVSGHIDFKTATAAGTNTLTFPAGTTDFSSTGGASQVVEQTSSGGAFTVARLACADLSNAGTACLASNTITLNAGSNVGITAPGAMTLGNTYTFGSTSDTPRFAGLGLGGTASGANILTIFGSSSGHIDVQTPAATGSNVATIPANTGIIAEVNLAQTWSAAQTFSSNDLILAGSSTPPSAVNPTWTWTAGGVGTGANAALIATFKANGTIAFVSGASKIGAGATTTTTSAINTTGATLLVVTVTQYSGAGAGTLSDNKSNSWSTAVGPIIVGETESWIFYSTTGNVGSGHTFAFAGGTAAAVDVQSFSQTATSSALDQTNSNTSTGNITSLQTGSVTPSIIGEVIIAGWTADNSTASLSINSSFTIPNPVVYYSNGFSEAGAAAYFIQAGGSGGTLLLDAAAAAGTHTLTFPAGTTDFSATGGTNQIVKQTSLNGAFTVATLTPTDLSSGLTSCSTNTLPWYSSTGTVLACMASVNNALVVTSSAGVPTESAAAMGLLNFASYSSLGGV
jgi:hypothetical protein